MLYSRVPPWFREDPLVRTISDETEQVKIKTYNDIMEAFPKQPLQIWADFKDQEFTFEQTVWNGNNDVEIDITGAYPAMFDFTIQTYDTGLSQPIEITDGENTLIIRYNIPTNSTAKIGVDERLLIDNSEVFSVLDQSQDQHGALVILGKSDSNWRLKQTFTTTKSKLREVEVMFGPTAGNPEDDISLSLCDSEDTLIEEKIIPIEVINAFVDEPLIIGFEQPLEALTEYSLIFERTGDIEMHHYFTLRASTELYDDGTLYGYNDYEWNETTVTENLGAEEIPEWVTQEGSIYFKTKIPPIVGDYPVLDPPVNTISLNCSNCPDEFMLEENGVTFSGIANGVVLDKIFVRAFAQDIHPLRSIRVYLHKEQAVDLIEEAQFKRQLNQQCFFVELSVEDINIPPTTLPFRMHAEVQYWGLQYGVNKGFPQSYDDEDPAFLFNENLDEIIKLYGIFRRKYKTEIPYYDYYKTYPKGYPWEYEQDYWLEKRLNDEYATRPDKIDMLTLYDTENEGILELRCKSPDIHNVEIYINPIGEQCCVCPDEQIQAITITDKDIQGLIRTQEVFYYTDNSIELMDDINYGSDLLEATYLNNTHRALNVETLFLYTEGTYQAYGLIKAEINQYLGVIPKIKDMADYCLIWDKPDRHWDSYVWAGDIWDAGVFELLIPYDKIPKNFELLDVDDILQIMGRCKPFGTRAIPKYTIERLLAVDLYSEFAFAEFMIDAEELEFQSEVTNMFAGLQTTFEVMVAAIESHGAESASLSIGFNLAFEVAQMLDSGTIDLSKGVHDNTRISSGKVVINTDTRTDERGPASVYTSGGGWGWNNQGAITDGINGNYANSTNGYGGPGCGGSCYTQQIHGVVYPQVPADATITGLAVRVRYANSSTYRSPYFTQLVHTVHITNNNLYALKGPTGYTGGGGAYDAWFGWDGDMWGGQSSEPWVYNQGVDIWYNATIDRQRTAYVDYMYLVIWYRRKGGNYYTIDLAAPTVQEPDVGNWDQLIISETKPAGTSVQYDIYQDIVDQSQAVSTLNQPFGQSLYTEVSQTFTPTSSWLSGVWVKAGTPAQVGTPAGNPRIMIKSSPHGSVLQQYDIPKAEWTNGAEIFVPFFLTVTPGTKYDIGWGKDSAGDNVNYFNMAYVNQNLYDPSKVKTMSVYHSGVGWETINAGNASAWFKTTFGSYLLTNQTNPINIAALPFVSLRVKAKLATNNPSTTPSVNEVRIKGKVIKN